MERGEVSISRIMSFSHLGVKDTKLDWCEI